MLTRVLRSSGMTSFERVRGAQVGQLGVAHHDRRGARIGVDVRGQAALPGGGHQRRGVGAAPGRR